MFDEENENFIFLLTFFSILKFYNDYEFCDGIIVAFFLILWVYVSKEHTCRRNGHKLQIFWKAGYEIPNQYTDIHTS